MNTSDEHTLPQAVDDLYTAVGQLVDPLKEWHGGTLRQSPSLYEMLSGAVPARSHGDGGRFVGRSMPPAWSDALDAKQNIDRRAKVMYPGGGSTPQRLRALAARRWHPQDVREVRDHAAEIASWAPTIRSLIDPAHVKHIDAPCPSCGRRWVYRQSAGEQVRQPALSLVLDEGASCAACRVHYPPDKYLFLCRLLGFDLPAGLIDAEP